MRLTPSWVRSSRDASSEESTGDGESLDIEVPIYYSAAEPTENPANSTASATSFVPESDSALLDELRELEAPVTVDELADHLIWPKSPPIETWADVHEFLYDERLPALHERGVLEFNADNGVVEHIHKASDHPETPWLTRPVLGLLSLILLATTLIIVSTTVATATVPF